MHKSMAAHVLLAGSVTLAAAFVLAGSVILSSLPVREELPGPEETPSATETMDPEVIEKLNELYGLEEPPASEPPSYLELLLQGDWGVSIKSGR